MVTPLILQIFARLWTPMTSTAFTCKAVIFLVPHKKSCIYIPNSEWSCRSKLGLWTSSHPPSSPSIGSTLPVTVLLWCTVLFLASFVLFAWKCYKKCSITFWQHTNAVELQLASKVPFVFTQHTRTHTGCWFGQLHPYTKWSTHVFTDQVQVWGIRIL